MRTWGFLYELETEEDLKTGFLLHTSKSPPFYNAVLKYTHVGRIAHTR